MLKGVSPLKNRMFIKNAFFLFTFTPSHTPPSIPPRKPNCPTFTQLGSSLTVLPGHENGVDGAEGGQGRGEVVALRKASRVVVCVCVTLGIIGILSDCFCFTVVFLV